MGLQLVEAVLLRLSLPECLLQEVLSLPVLQTLRVELSELVPLQYSKLARALLLLEVL